jgi:glycosyltransferase involved in cell wall biosynthesis
MKQITIVTVCYNSEKTIEKTFQSLLNQTQTDFEYIVIDGASTDNTLSLIQKYQPMFGTRMKYISEKDSGIYDAMNKGIAISTGTYIGLLNSDDWYEPHTVKSIQNAINENTPHEIGFYYGMIRIIKEQQEYMIRRHNPAFFTEGHGFIQHPATFISRKAYESVGLYDTRYKVCADQDLMLRLVKSGITHKPIDVVLTNFTQNGITFSYDSFEEQLRFKLEHNLITYKIAKKLRWKHKFNNMKTTIEKYLGIHK